MSVLVLRESSPIFYGQKTSVIPRRELAARVQNYNYNAENVGIPKYAFMHLYSRLATLRQLLPACSAGSSHVVLAAFMRVSEHILGNYLFFVSTF